MRARMKFEIAEACGMSNTTFARWCKSHQKKLKSLGVTPRQRLLPPRAVRYICEELGIHEEDFFVA